MSGEKHCQAGKRIAEELLTNANFNDSQKEKIFSCILSHNLQEIPLSIEEQIVRTSDGGSKVQYHEAFMLLCNKNTYEERLAWGMKYLEKGYSNISLESYKKEVEQKPFLIVHTFSSLANASIIVSSKLGLLILRMSLTYDTKTKELLFSAPR